MEWTFSLLISSLIDSNHERKRRGDRTSAGRICDLKTCTVTVRRGKIYIFARKYNLPFSQTLADLTFIFPSQDSLCQLTAAVTVG